MTAFGPIRGMVMRSAYAELNYSPLRLAAATLGMALTFLAGPLLALFASGTAAVAGAAVWLMLAIALQPTLRLYRLNPLWGLALPPIALAYMVWTVESALQYARGQGGQWKGRIQAAPRGAPRCSTLAADVRSGKDHRGENFPVASMLIAARHRKPIMAFYDFVRVADDVADHPTLSQADKLTLLDSLEATLLGKSECRAARHRAARATG